MSKYVLHYFKLKARAELARLVFAAADVKYEYRTYTFPEWPEHKKEYEFGQLPVLEVDGVQLNQSQAIPFFLAKEFGLSGSNNLEEAKCIALSDTVKDFIEDFFKIAYNSELSEDARQEKLKEYHEKKLKASLEMMEAYFKKHISPEGYIIGHKLSLGDLIFTNVYNLMKEKGKFDTDEMLAPYPTMLKHAHHIASHPRIKHFFEVASNQPYA